MLLNKYYRKVNELWSYILTGGIMDVNKLIKIKIENDINNFDSIEVGIINKNNIYNYIIEPRYEEYIDINNNKIMLWTVFESDNFGYKIVYSEKNGEFGLAMISMGDEKIFLGIYGGFVETLSSM
jgi:hypothetical protein